jgi:S1-C subfamily serine protease
MPTTRPGWPQREYEQVVSRVLPSVVQISTGTGTRSGVVYDGRGDIVINAHVVGAAATVDRRGERTRRDRRRGHPRR